MSKLRQVSEGARVYPLDGTRWGGRSLWGWCHRAEVGAALTGFAADRLLIEIPHIFEVVHGLRGEARARPELQRTWRDKLCLRRTIAQPHVWGTCYMSWMAVSGGLLFKHPTGKWRLDGRSRRSTIRSKTGAQSSELGLRSCSLLRCWRWG